MQQNGLFLSVSASETENFGRKLAEILRSGDVLAISGDLGAGKSCLARGIGRGLGVPTHIPIVSPTFTLVQSYEGHELEFHHFDFYRVADFEELEAIGFRDYLGDRAVIVVEWPAIVPDALPPVRLDIQLVGDGNHRQIRWQTVGWSQQRAAALGALGQR